MSKSRRNRGFTLIETLVAFTILAMTLGAVFAALSTGMTAEFRADRTVRATLLARSALAEVGVARPLEPGVHLVEFDNGDFYRVETFRIDPFASAELAADSAAYEVVVEAGADGRVAATLRTVRLGPLE